MKITVTRRDPGPQPVESVILDGAHCTRIEARRTTDTTSFQVATCRLDNPAKLYFSAQACRDAAKFFTRLAKIIDNGGNE